jgi:hypothetical protein
MANGKRGKLDISVIRDEGHTRYRSFDGPPMADFEIVMENVKWVCDLGGLIDLRTVITRPNNTAEFGLAYAQAHAQVGLSIEPAQIINFGTAVFARETITVEEFLGRLSASGIDRLAFSDSEKDPEPFACGNAMPSVRLRRNTRAAGASTGDNRYSRSPCWSWSTELRSDGPQGEIAEIGTGHTFYPRVLDMILELGGMRRINILYDTRYYSFNIVASDPRGAIIDLSVNFCNQAVVTLEGLELGSYQLRAMLMGETVGREAACQVVIADDLALPSSRVAEVLLVDPASGEIIDSALYTLIPSPPLLDRETRAIAPALLDAAGGQVGDILFVAANPRGYHPLRLGEEQKVIHDAVSLAKLKGLLDLETRMAATFHDLRRAMLDRKYRILHIAGHGTQCGLIFENQQGNELSVPVVDLLSYLDEYAPPKGQLECVVLNACQTATVTSGLISRIPYLIVMEGDTDDRGAIEFTRGFYDALARGHDLERSFVEGQHTARLGAPGASLVAHLLKSDSRRR